MDQTAKRTVPVSVTRSSEYLPNRFYKCFIFIRGFRFVSISGIQSMNTTCDITD